MIRELEMQEEMAVWGGDPTTLDASGGGSWNWSGSTATQASAGAVMIEIAKAIGISVLYDYAVKPAINGLIDSYNNAVNDPGQYKYIYGNQNGATPASSGGSVVFQP